MGDIDIMRPSSVVINLKNSYPESVCFCFLSRIKDGNQGNNVLPYPHHVASVDGGKGFWEGSK